MGTSSTFAFPPWLRDILTSRTIPLIILGCLMCFTGGYILALQSVIIDNASSTFSSRLRSTASFMIQSKLQIQQQLTKHISYESQLIKDNLTDYLSFSSLTIVISRSTEDITWVSHLTRLPYPPRIIVYNDGQPLDKLISKGIIEIQGDHLPSECSKYLRYIIDNYDTLSPLTLFTQGDPFPHSPDFLGLLYSFSDWKLPVQPLSYRGHPYIIINGRKQPWGPHEALYNEIWSEKFINNNRIYYEEMDETFQGTIFQDPFISEYIHPLYWDIDKNAPKPFTISNLWKFLGITKPLPPKYYKAYAAIFGVSRYGIQRHSKSTYETMYNWLNITANIYIPKPEAGSSFQDNNNLQKSRAIALEYMWPTIFGMQEYDVN